MSETQLLVVDMQQVFADPTSPWAVPGFDGVVAAVAPLLEEYVGRAALTRFVPHEEPEGSWLDYYEAYPFAAAPGSEAQWELVSALQAHDLPVLDAPTMSKWTPDIAAMLDHPDTLVLAGVATECCVLATALAASDAGVRVRVVADACAGGSARDHDAALRVLGAFDPQVQVI